MLISELSAMVGTSSMCQERTIRCSVTRHRAIPPPARYRSIGCVCAADPSWLSNRIIVNDLQQVKSGAGSCQGKVEMSGF
jgi:hypothetical protein